MFRKVSTWLNAGTLMSLLPVLFLALADLQRVVIGPELRGALVAASAIGLAVALAVGCGYVGPETIMRIGWSRTTLVRMMLGMWGMGLVSIAALATAEFAAADVGLRQTFGNWSLALVALAVVGAELGVVAGMLVDRLKAAEAGNEAQLEHELEEARSLFALEKQGRENLEAKVLEQNERALEDLAAWAVERQRLRDGLAGEEAEVLILRDGLVKAEERYADQAEDLYQARQQAAALAGELDRLRLERAGETLRSIAYLLEDGAHRTARQIAEELGFDPNAIRAAIDRGVELQVIERQAAPEGSPATWSYSRQRISPAKVAELEGAEEVAS